MTFPRLVLPILGLLALALQGCISIPLVGFGNDRGRVALQTVEPAKHFWTSDEILMIPLSGMVAEGDMTSRLGEPGMLVGLKDRLKAAKDNQRVKAIVLRIDSPGGTITASDLIYRELLRFKQEKQVPVVAIMTDTAASGGLYIAMAADEVYALPTTITGSIGAIAMLPGVAGLIEKVGVEMRIVKSGRNKDIGSLWKPMSDEQRALLQTLIDGYYQRFFSVIVESRSKAGLTTDTLRPVADGRILTPQQALDVKIIDGIKYPDEVFERAKSLAGIEDASITTYEFPYNYRGHVYAEADPPSPRVSRQGGNLNLFNFDLDGISEALLAPQFYYLWMP